MAGFVGLGTLWRLRPSGPVVDPRTRQQTWTGAPSGVTYTSPPGTPLPTPPLIPFGVAYDLDLVLVSDHPDWNMHEYARVRTADGPVWLAKDSREEDGTQELVIGLPEGSTLLPEVPLPRRLGGLTVDADLGHDRIAVALEYTNHRGEPVRATYEGPPARTAQRKRNGSTVEHSQHHVLAALDLSHQDFGRGSISIGGTARRLRRALGLIPMALALRQTQGGLAVGALRVDGTTATFGETRVDLHREGEDLVLRDALRTLRWSFVDRELKSVTVTQSGRPTPTFHAAFAPAIPDLTRSFDGTWTGRFVFDVNGQEGHATGELVARSGEGVGTLEVVGEAPWWVAARPLRSTVRGGELTVRSLTGS